MGKKGARNVLRGNLRQFAEVNSSITADGIVGCLEFRPEREIENERAGLSFVGSRNVKVEKGTESAVDVAEVGSSIGFRWLFAVDRNYKVGVLIRTRGQGSAAA